MVKEGEVLEESQGKGRNGKYKPGGMMNGG
jgi:hypothetical protein